jgi:hypothetical protein
MTKYKIVIQFETPEKFKKNFIKDVCKQYKEELADDTGIFGLVNVDVDWNKFYEIEYKGHKYVMEGKNADEVEWAFSFLHQDVPRDMIKAIEYSTLSTLPENQEILNKHGGKKNASKKSSS